jgi:uncharacterized membrane protein
MPFEYLIPTGLALIFVGILVAIATIYLHFKNPNAKEHKGSYVFLGPIPVSFSSMKTGDNLKVLMITSLLLVIIFSIWLFYLNK